jgi:nucleoside-diphosphate-sugar epimerase
MTTRHLVIGAGPVGRHVASILVERGDQVVIGSRTGRDTGVAGATHIALTPPTRRRSCARPTVWPGCSARRTPVATPSGRRSGRRWRPLCFAAAEKTGAVYAMTGNLYPIGPVTEPMREDMPDAARDHKGVLRARIWASALAAHQAGRVRAFEVRGSDYIGAGGPEGHISRALPIALAGHGVRMVGRVDQPHTFTDVKDVARVLVAALDDPTAHGRTWHVPSHAPVTQRQAMDELMDAAGQPRVRVRDTSPALMRALGIVSPLLREVSDLTYQLTRPYILDDSAARQHFGIEPSDWDDTLRRTLDAARQQERKKEGSST